MGAIDATLYSLIGLAFVVLGVVVLVRYAGFPDLTVDGSFTIAAALFAVTVKEGAGSTLAMSAAIGAGALSGLLTWTLNQVLGMGRVVSGVLSMIMLILVAPYVARGASIGLLNPDPLHSWLRAWDEILTDRIGAADVQQLHFATILFWLGVLGLVAAAWLGLFRSRLGLQLRYLGSARSPTLVNPRRRKWLLLFGLMLGNGLVGLGAAVEAVRRGGFSSNIGLGILLSGLAIMILGEALVKAWRRRDFLRVREQFWSAVVGLVAYGISIQLILRYGPAVIDVRLASTIMLVVLLGVAARFFPNSAKLF